MRRTEGEIWAISTGEGLSEMSKWSLDSYIDALLDSLVDARKELKKRERP